MKAFLYARVSTGDQSVDMQVRELEAYAERLHTEEVHVFTETESGAKNSRPVLDAMMEKIRRRKCDVLIVYRFDRFARSTRQLVNALEEFSALGVQFISVHEAIDTTTPMGKFAFTVFAAIAEFERELIRERVRSGMAHAKANGKHIGRPSLGLDAREIISLKAKGMTWQEIADVIGAGASTVRKFIRRELKKSSEVPRPVPAPAE